MENKQEELQPLVTVIDNHIMVVMKSVDYNRTKAAKILKMGVRTLQRRIVKMIDRGIDVPVNPTAINEVHLFSIKKL